MGNDEAAVVDPECRVNGVASLRVVDASIMQQATAGDLNAPTIMLAERAADLIRGRKRPPANPAPLLIDPQRENCQRSTGIPLDLSVQGQSSAAVFRRQQELLDRACQPGGGVLTTWETGSRTLFLSSSTTRPPERWVVPATPRFTPHISTDSQ